MSIRIRFLLPFVGFRDCDITAGDVAFISALTYWERYRDSKPLLASHEETIRDMMSAGF